MGGIMGGRKFKTGVVLLAVVLVIYMAVSQIRKNNENNRKERLAAEQKAEQEKAAKLDQQRRIAQLASKTNAITKWREEFSNNGRFLFTADVTRVFVRPDGRAILFDRAEAQDVAQRGEGFLCYFGVDLSPDRFGANSSPDDFLMTGNTTRRFVVSGTELGQESVATFNESLLLPESVENNSTTARLALSCDPSMAKEIMQHGEGKSFAVVARISAVPSYKEITTDESSDESLAEPSIPND